MLWLYLYCGVLQWIYAGGSPVMEDFGLSAGLFGWGLVWLCAVLVAIPISNKVFGFSDRTSVIYSGLLSVPFSVVLSLLLDPHYHGYPFEKGTLGYYLAKAFYFIGAFGLLPEGRRHMAAGHVVNMLAIFCASYLGYWRGAVVHQKNQAGRRG